MYRFARIVLPLGLFLSTLRVFAQSDSAAAAQEVRQQVNDLQRQLKIVQTRLNEPENQKAPPASNETQNKPSSQEGTAQPSKSPLQGTTSPQVGEATTIRN